MTAVEWFVEKLNKRWYGLDEGETWNDLIQQALEMEKEQCEKEFERGYTKCADTLQFILDKGLLNNYNNDTNDHRSGKPTIRTKR